MELSYLVLIYNNLVQIKIYVPFISPFMWQEVVPSRYVSASIESTLLVTEAKEILIVTESCSLLLPFLHLFFLLSVLSFCSGPSFIVTCDLQPPVLVIARHLLVTDDTVQAPASVQSRGASAFLVIVRHLLVTDEVAQAPALVQSRGTSAVCLHHLWFLVLMQCRPGCIYYVRNLLFGCESSPNKS